ncbi:MAG: tagatose 1,6-diphosphate aldolase [Chloroflexi bacterium]|nr:tagatose 1,6-diphosphate aldolase [Chloroflexota bacterium]
MMISPGRIRGLQASAAPQGIFTILAIDHRDALRVMLDAHTPESVPASQLTELKLAITRCLAPQASAVLLDPLYSAAQAITSQALPGHVGLLCALEEQGYLGDPHRRRTTLLPGWSVEKAKRLGATGVKILLFYHPEAGMAAEKQEQLVRAVLAECHRWETPFFLEPISYSLDPSIQKGSVEFARLRRRIVVESARRLGALGPDVLKVEFPVDVKHDTDQAAWAEACAELDEAASAPWALLSADEPFEVFKQQLRVACQAGCSGFLAGRAVWRGAVKLTGAERENFLENVARRRFAELVEIALEFGKPWQRRHSLPEINEQWHLQY